ncbi:MAG: glycosyltransferase, partial [Desulfosporosinus sp.]|nr:glycosyltransferase [Desulfosporosinus sp.]
MKNIWIFNQYNMPPEYGHLNRHYNFGKYLKRAGYNPVVFVGSNLHNSNVQMIQDDSLYKIYEDCDYPYVFVKTCAYDRSRIKRVYAMFEFYRNICKVTKEFDRPDVILGSSAHPLAPMAAIKLAKKYHCKSVVEVRDLWPESFVAYKIIKKSNPLLKLLYAGEKWIYKKADSLVFTMKGAKDYIVNRGWDMESG